MPQTNLLTYCMEMEERLEALEEAFVVTLLARLAEDGPEPRRLMQIDQAAGLSPEELDHRRRVLDRAINLLRRALE